MSMDYKNVSTLAGTALESVKRIVTLIRGRHFLKAAREIINLFKILYKKHLQGKYITIKGRQIPLTLVVIIAALGLYFFYPQSENRILDLSEAEQSSENETNTYNQDGVRVYDLEKCDNNSVCGLIENASEKPVSHLSVIVIFYDNSGNILYRGGAEAKGIQPMTRLKLLIPSDVPFDYFVLDKVEVER